MLDNRTNLGLEVVQDIKSYFKEKVYDTIKHLYIVINNIIIIQVY